MSKTRMFDDDDPAVANSSPRTTIVGGRPPEERTDLPPVPTGLQRLLRLASVDEEFRDQLVARRAEVAIAVGISLTASEQAILTSVPAADLARMAASMPAPPTDRRDFLRQTAATAVVFLGGAALEGCDRPQRRSVETVGGAAPDMPPDLSPDNAEPPAPRPDHSFPAPGGAAPDEPPPRPANREMETEGGAAPHEPPPTAQQ